MKRLLALSLFVIPLIVVASGFANEQAGDNMITLNNEEFRSRLSELRQPTNQRDYRVEGVIDLNGLDSNLKIYVRNLEFTTAGKFQVFSNDVTISIAQSLEAATDGQLIIASFPDSAEKAPTGRNGLNGAGGANAAAPGAKGYDGMPGSPGDSGQSGADAGNVTLILNNAPRLKVRVDLAGQSGGDGGNGGYGGPGGNGGAGQAAFAFIFGCRSAATSGGPGGNGGNGGDGGRGGDPGRSGTLTISQLNHDHDSATFMQKIGLLERLARPGRSGAGGLGGVGGRGGEGGHGSSFCVGAPNGPAGSPGRAGLSGPPANITIPTQAQVEIR